MITRGQMKYTEGLNLSDRQSDELEALLRCERNQYQELVEAAAKYKEWCDVGPGYGCHEGKPVCEAVKPFIKLSLSEKLTKLADMMLDPPSLADMLTNPLLMTLKELASEAETLEQERELMKYR